MYTVHEASVGRGIGFTIANLGGPSLRRNIRYTHDSIARSFADGRNFDELLESLSGGSVRSLQDTFLALQVVCVDGVQYSLDNRRLYVLKTQNYASRFVLWATSVAIDN